LTLQISLLILISYLEASGDLTWKIFPSYADNLTGRPDFHFRVLLDFRNQHDGAQSLSPEAFNENGHRGARLTSQLLDRVDKLLGVVLLGNTLVNAGATTLATVIAIRLFGGGELVLWLSTVAVTFLLLVFSEITPKVVGANATRDDRFSRRIHSGAFAQARLPGHLVRQPVRTRLIMAAALAAHSNQAHTLSMEELRTLILEGGNFLPQKHQKILLNLFDLEAITVEDAMTPRIQIEAVDIESPPDEIRRQIAISNHTRLPVYRERLDDVIGIVHVRKVLNLSEGENIDAQTLIEVLREPYFIPMGTPLLTQLQNFQEQHDRMGLVVDEYGELKGLLTLEDILER
jgi:Mg2+/Co2+ transporter CorB